MSSALKTVAWLATLGFALAVLFLTDDNRILTIAIQTFILGALATSWNILGGFAGQISLGHAAFFGTGVLVTRELWLDGWPVIASLIVAVLVTSVFAGIVGVPMLRFRGIYFSIGTLALAVAVALTVANVRPGISSLPVEALRSYTFTGPYLLALSVLAISVAISMWLKRSKLGLGMMAVREDEEAAGATGVNVLGHKMAAFVISAGLAALAGGAFAIFSVSYYPSFPFGAVWTFDAILVVFIGGIGTIAGPLIGSTFFVVGRDTLASNFEEIQVILFGVLFIVVVLLLPGGIVEGGQRLVALVSRRGAGDTTGKEAQESMERERELG
jgi:branched-chain amino acid transport system permease protein